MRLIDADALLANLEDEPYVWTDTAEEIQERNDWQEFLHFVLGAPTIDAVPMVHGKWIDSAEHGGYCVCSACHDCYVDGEWVIGGKWSYCPNCGAKMDKEDLDFV